MSTLSTGKVWVYRREGISVGTSKESLRQSFPSDVRDQIQVTSLGPGINLDQGTLTATFSFTAKPGDELLQSEDKDFYGFTPLHTPEGDIEADIIALTGLAGHAFGSWAASPHMWLRDFLPIDLPRARVLLYGYDSSLAGSQSRNILADLSSNFVVKFHTMRSLSRCENRPIILIGHSLGCLIIKDALTDIRSNPVNHLSQSLPIVKAVIFFGAPHRGLNINALQSIMNGTPSADLIRELSWQSPTIQKLNNGFRHVCEGLDILTIYEKTPTATLRKSKSGRLKRTGPLEMMVEKDSALLYLTKEISFGLEQDHSRIAKVDRGQNGCYDEIVHFIRQSISSALTRRESLQSYPEFSPIHSSGTTARDTRAEIPPLPIRRRGSFVTYDAHGAMGQKSLAPSKARKPLFLVPFDRDTSFINRVEIFDDIRKYSKQHRRLALSGIGGIGKSQIAIEYCYQFRDDYPYAHIFWVHASTKQRFEQAYRDIARRLELPGWNDPNNDTLLLVSKWLNEAANESWLMVLDNADDLDTFFVRPNSTTSDNELTLPLKDHLPQSSKGLLLITTRDERLAKRLAGSHASIVVNAMSPREAQELLEKWQTSPSSSSNIEHSRHLLEALGYIPLAITQAAAFISENHITLAQYLDILHTSDSDIQDLLDEDLGDRRRDAQSQNSVIRTWKISFDLIGKQKPRAAEMLSLIAVLDRQGIPESLLRRKTDRNIDFRTALGTLQAFSLVTAGVSGAGYEIHRLVQLATRKWLEFQGKIDEWEAKALLVVADVFPYGKFENWTTCESLLPHAQKVIQYEDATGKFGIEFSELLSKMASFSLDQKRYEVASTRYLAAIEAKNKTCGLDDTSMLSNMNDLAEAYIGQGRSKEAEELLMQVLEARKGVLGVEHPDTLSSISNLAHTYQEQGRWKEAEELYMQVIEAQKRVLKLEHRDTLTSLHNLAYTYREQGRLREAEEVYVQVIEAGKTVLGAEHPDTLTSLNNLAYTYKNQGRWREAEKVYVQVLDARERVLGAEHPDILTSLYNLVYTYQEQGRLGEAEEVYVQVIEAQKRVLGAEHPDILISLHNLAYTYQEQGRWGEAEEVYVQVIEARKGVLGVEHPDTLISLSSLAKTYLAQDRWEEAEEVYVQVIEAEKTVLGTEHPDRLTSMHNLALVYKSQGRHSDAIALMESVVELSTKRLGADHPDTKASASWLKKWLDA